MYSTTYNVNIVPGNVPINIHISQYDAGTRQFEFVPYSVPGEIDTSAVATVTLEATKPDGYGVVNTCSWNGSKAVYTVQQQLAAVVGKVWSKLVFRGSDSEVLGSAAIIWTVDPAGLKDNAVISDSDIAQMEEWIEEIGDATAEALKAEGYAIGEQSGTPVSSGSPYYQNNSKYYSQQAASVVADASTYATNAANSATAAAGSATSASGSATAAANSATQASGYVNQAIVLGGTPLVASTAAGMTDHSKVYVYTGSETGYSGGSWYYWNGSAWAVGGVYNSVAVQTDPTLSVSGVAADGAACGIRYSVLKRYVDGEADYCVTNLFSDSDLELGEISSSGVEQDSTTAYRNKNYYILNATGTILSNYNVGVCFYDKDFTFISRATGTSRTIPTGAMYYRCRIGTNVYNSHAGEIIVTNEAAIPSTYIPYKPEYVLKNSVFTSINESRNLFDPTDFETGGISDNGSENTYDTVMRDKTYLKLISTDDIYFNYTGYICFYTAGKNFISRVQSTDTTVGVTVPVNARYYRLVFAKTVITAHWNDISVRFNRTRIENNCNMAGRHFWIYKFGGDGNDWCFVHTPSDYDPLRKQPYPFIICNHGNGTAMDGDPVNACWTPRTMYVPVGTAVSQYDQIETSDETLWYSNPTIEALLTAGYVVCGAENYGERLYGNENCRKACVDFFHHMVSNYNVTDYCGMIGASNGAQTSINAAYYLQGKIRAMVFQYPLTCLINQYNSNEDHQPYIRSAYDMPDSPTAQDLITYTATHDSLHTNIVDGVRVDEIPPTKLYYSLTDTVTQAVDNAIPFYNMLVNSTKIAEYVQVDSDGTPRGHGHVDHFDPAGFVAFFDKFLS